MELTKNEQAVLSVLTQEPKTSGLISILAKRSVDTSSTVMILRSLYRKGLAEPLYPDSWWWRITVAGKRQRDGENE